MQRFVGQDLPTTPHIAVLFAEKLGGFVVATPLLRGLKEKYPSATLDYFGGDLTAELEESCRYVDSRVSLFGPAEALRRVAAYATERQGRVGAYDLAINLDTHPVNAVVTALLVPTFVVGRTYTPDGRRLLPFLMDDPVDRLHEEDWSAPDLLVRYRGVLRSRFIGEIFCRLARVETDFARTEVAAEPSGLAAVPDVLVSTGGTRAAKLWPTEHWVELVRRLEGRGLTVGLLGGSPAKQRAHYGSAETDEALLASTRTVDLRGKLRLPQVAGALRAARACVTIDNGIMHLAYSVGTPTVALFGASPWQLWAPTLPNLSVVLPPEACSLCAENRFRNDSCLRERHVCLESITPSLVLARLDEQLARGQVRMASTHRV